jgi:hypothetical protein
MRTFVESLKRLYKKGQVTTEKIAQLTAEGKITAAEYKYITGEDYSA